MIGWIVGILYALADGWLMRYIVKKASRNPAKASKMVTCGFIVRYLLTVAVLVFALLTSINAIGVIVPLIVQKVMIVVMTLVKRS